MKKRTLLTVPLALVLTMSILLVQPLFSSASATAISGAIFTTDETGLLVDGNIYADALDVYLSGGPGPNAPPDAAGLPDGDYYFQVTDPPGKRLLSTDNVENRSFRVFNGIITEYLGTTHNWNIIGSEIPDAIVIQLWPFGKTPNKGGVYKAWATPIDNYNPDDPHSHFGFIPKHSKTDNYKVRKERPITRLILEKFHDVDKNGLYDNEDYLLEGWPIHVTDPLGTTNTYYTPRTIDITNNPGTYIVTEDVLDGWEQTAVAVDGIYKPVDVTVNVEIKNGETHRVLYGNTMEEIPTPPPPIYITLSISPIRVAIGEPTRFHYMIPQPPDVVPVWVEIKVHNGADEILYSGDNFPSDYEKTIFWTAKLPTGLWTVRVDYYYTYHGSPYRAGAEASFRVVS